MILRVCDDSGRRLDLGRQTVGLGLRLCNTSASRPGTLQNSIISSICFTGLKLINISNTSIMQCYAISVSPHSRLSLLHNDTIRREFGIRNFRPRGRKFHRVELSSPGTKVPWNFPWNFRYLELSFPGTKVSWNFRPMVLFHRTFKPCHILLNF